MSRDKILHFGVSFAIEFLFVFILGAWPPWQRAFINILFVGGGKELYDYKHPEHHSADWKDLVADAAGAVAGEVVFAIIRSVI